MRKWNVYSDDENMTSYIESKMYSITDVKTQCKSYSQSILSLLFILGTKSEGDKYSVTQPVTEFTMTANKLILSSQVFASQVFLSQPAQDLILNT